MRPGANAGVWALCAAASYGCAGCHRGRPGAKGAPPSEAGLVSAPSATAAGSPRGGMIWIPAGAFRAGTPVDRVPRIAEEELPGTEIALGGYYIDVLAYPNEAGAIPATSVSRDDAARLCESRAKRLCSELEWERACKGPEGTTYEYGDAYREGVCGTGVTAEQSATRPSGERQACKSAFGVMGMHGGPWEWTDAAWGRGTTRDLGVLRGGNAVAGELVGRCANALARHPSSKSPTMGLRCCAGPKNDAIVDLPLSSGPALERSMKTAELTAPLAKSFIDTDGPLAFAHAWTWRPVANEQLVLASGCTRPPLRCRLIVARLATEAPETGMPPRTLLASIDTGHEAAEVAEVGDARHLRLKGVDEKSPFLRDFAYAYGRVDLGDIKR